MVGPLPYPAPHDEQQCRGEGSWWFNNDHSSRGVRLQHSDRYLATGGGNLGTENTESRISRDAGSDQTSEGENCQIHGGILLGGILEGYAALEEMAMRAASRSEEHTSELQPPMNLVC